jgi:RNase P protein component
VERNRIKRRLREVVRATRPAAGIAADVVVNPKKSVLHAEFSELLNEVSRAFAVIEGKLSQKNLKPKETTAKFRVQETEERS